MNLNLARKLHLRATTQAFEQNVALDLELMFVAGVLVMASATRGKIRAGRRDSVERCFYHRFGLRSGECRLLLDNRSLYLLAREHKRKEDGLTRTTGIRWQVSQSVAAINQLFDCEEQELILRHRSPELWRPDVLRLFAGPRLHTLSVQGRHPNAPALAVI